MVRRWAGGQLTGRSGGGGGLALRGGFIFGAFVFGALGGHGGGGGFWGDGSGW